MQFTMVSEVPLDSPLAFFAINVENKGESAITTIAQKTRNMMSIVDDGLNKNKGESRQQQQERNNEIVAIFFAPKDWESNPLSTQAIPPDAITRKDNKEIFRSR